MGAVRVKFLAEEEEEVAYFTLREGAGTELEEGTNERNEFVFVQ